MNPYRPLLLVPCLLALLSCSRGAGTPALSPAPAEAPTSSSFRMEAGAESAGRARDGSAADAADAGDAADPTALAAAASRKLIRTGSLTIRVTDASGAAERIEDLAVRRGGYVSGMNGGRDGAGRSSLTITIRVPQDDFQATLRSLRALGVVESETVSTEDVGREYADLEARLSMKRAVAERMREILSTKTAKLEDLFAAERQLASVLEEIERLEGQRRYFDRQVALSTITASVHEPDVAVTAVAELPPFLQPASEALLLARAHLSSLVGVATYVAILAAPWVVLVALAAMLVRARRARPIAASTG